jgi:hypothetical protein
VLKLAPKFGDLARIEGIDREMEAAVAIGRDLIRAEQLGHAVSQSCLYQSRQASEERDRALPHCQEAVSYGRCSAFMPGAPTAEPSTQELVFRWICPYNPAIDGHPPATNRRLILP